MLMAASIGHLGPAIMRSTDGGGRGPLPPGLFESLDQGASWHTLNQNVEANFLPDPYPEFGQDAHYLELAPTLTDSGSKTTGGIYRLDRPGERLERIGNAMPKEIGDVGFSIVPHAHDADTAMGLSHGRDRGLAAGQPWR